MQMHGPDVSELHEFLHVNRSLLQDHCVLLTKNHFTQLFKQLCLIIFTSKALVSSPAFSVFL